MTALGSIETFLARWQAAGGSERANYQIFVTELCELLDLPKPEPARDDARDNAYVFERRVVFKHGDGSTSNGFIDCYRRACFNLEAKKLKVGAGGTAKEQAIYDKGLVAVLASFHADLDAAVLDAYGWHDNPTDAQLLERLVALNSARRAEEAQGHIRWLRPAFQAPPQTQTVAAGLGVAQPTICDSHEEVGPPPAPPAPWPQSLPGPNRRPRRRAGPGAAVGGWPVDGVR